MSSRAHLPCLHDHKCPAVRFSTPKLAVLVPGPKLKADHNARFPHPRSVCGNLTFVIVHLTTIATSRNFLTTPTNNTTHIDCHNRSHFRAAAALGSPLAIPNTRQVTSKPPTPPRARDLHMRTHERTPTDRHAAKTNSIHFLRRRLPPGAGPPGQCSQWAHIQDQASGCADEQRSCLTVLAQQRALALALGHAHPE